MRYVELVSAVKKLAMRANINVGEAQWYLFGSAREELSNASDIDLLVICETQGMADMVRRIVNVDELARPIHLSILTRSEEGEVRFINRQCCVQIV
jgi:predicted nucleotidyltransferase